MPEDALVNRYGPGWKSRPWRPNLPLNQRINRIIQELKWMNDPVANLLGSSEAFGRGPANLPPLQAGMPETIHLSVPEKFLTYLQYIWACGALDSRNELLRGRKMVLGLRRPTASFANSGKGTYDDRMVILWRSYELGWAVRELAFNTEPTAQYDALTGSKNNPFPGVKYRHTEGEDVNDDGKKDLGRLQPGTYFFDKGSTASHPQHFRIAVPPVNPKGGVMRDVNHKGYFDGGAAALDKLNNSFLIHPGGVNNTDSAGCQTLPKVAPSNTVGFRTEPQPWYFFWATMSPQRSLTYVLVDTARPSGGSGL